MHHDPDDVASWLIDHALTLHQAQHQTTRERATRYFPDLDSLTWSAAIARLRTATAAASLGGGVCPGCRSPVRRLPADHAADVLVDPLPHPRGRVVLVRHGPRDVARILPRGVDPAGGSTRYQLHEDACPSSATPRPTRCDACGYRLDQLLVDAGAPKHPSCTDDPPPPALTRRPRGHLHLATN